MLIAIAVVALVLFNLFVVLVMHGSALRRAACPRCCSHDTRLIATGGRFCAECRCEFQDGAVAQLKSTA